MVKHLGRVIDPAPGDIGDVQQAVDAAEVDERTVIGDVLDDAVDDLTLFEVLHQFLALLGAGLFEHRAARHHDVAAAAIHLEDLERLRIVHQRRDVADRADVDLRARQEGHRAVEIDGEAALDLVEDDAVDLLVVVEGLLELAPAFLAARLVARQHGFAERILDAVEEHLDLVADLEVALAAGPANSRSATRPSVFRPTSMTAMSFSIATTMPLMTELSCRLPPAKDSSSIAAKSSREGL